jgi:predicted metal-binding membrane protein
VTPLALRRTAWSHPEAGGAALAAASWVILIAHYFHPHHGPEPYGAALSGWVVMAIAMMVPGAQADLRRIGLSSLWARRQRTIVLFLGAYQTVWLAFGAAALAVIPVAGPGVGVLLAGAAAWELTPWKWRAVRRCHLIEPLPPRGREADTACARAGVRYAGQCVASCWAMMLAMAAAGHLALPLMALLATVVTAEKLVVRSARLRTPAAAALAGAAVVAFA